MARLMHIVPSNGRSGLIVPRISSGTINSGIGPCSTVRRAVLAISAALIINCLSGTIFAGQAVAEPTGGGEYVALGSSFAAGPGVGSPVGNGPSFCGRSTDNYAHIVARERHLELIETSCSGSTAGDVLRASQASQPPQIDAVGPRTKLVTITTGGNDIAYIGNLYAWSCLGRPDRVNAALRRRVCQGTPDAVVDQRLAQLEDAMVGIATAVRERAPHAELMFVDYVTVLPASGSCPDRLPLSEAQLDRGRFVAAQLNRITKNAARRSGAVLVEASKLSRNHDVCANEPWVSGWEFPISPTAFGPIAYHPNQKAMEAIADALGQQLASSTHSQR